MRLSVCVIVVLLLTPGISRAQDSNEPSGWANAFFSIMVETGHQEAARVLKESYGGNAGPARVEKAAKQLVNAARAYGRALGFERVGRRRVGKSVTLLTYIVKYEKYCIFWQLDFYRPDKQWILANFKFFDDPSQIPHL